MSLNLTSPVYLTVTQVNFVPENSTKFTVLHNIIFNTRFSSWVEIS